MSDEINELKRLANPTHEMVEQLKLLRQELSDRDARIAKHEKSLLEYKALQAERDHKTHLYIKKSGRKGWIISVFIALLASVAFGLDVVRFGEEVQLHIDEIIPKFWSEKL